MATIIAWLPDDQGCSGIQGYFRIKDTPEGSVYYCKECGGMNMIYAPIWKVEKSEWQKIRELRQEIRKQKKSR